MLIIVILSLGGVLFFAAAVLYLQNHEDTIARHGNAYHAAKRYPRNTALYAYFSPHVRYLPSEGGPRSKVFPVISGLQGKEEFTLTAAEK